MSIEDLQKEETRLFNAIVENLNKLSEAVIAIDKRIIYMESRLNDIIPELN